jgi:hypothetical protein
MLRRVLKPKRRVAQAFPKTKWPKFWRVCNESRFSKEKCWCVCAHARACACVRVRACIYAYAHAYLRACVRALACVCGLACIHACMRE